MPSRLSIMLVVELLLALFWLWSATAASAAPPAIAANGIANAASRIPSTLPGGALAREARFILDGVRFGSTPVITIQGETSVRATIISATATRIEARIPQDAPLGPANLTVTSNKETSAAHPLIIVDANPGLYSRNEHGWGPGAIDNLNPRQPNSATRPARPGQSVLLRATGSPGPSAPVFIGNVATRVQSVRRNVQPGIDELSVPIPANAPEGCFVPVRLTGPNHSSNTVTIAISSSGPCTPSTSFPMPHWKPGNSAVVLLARSLSKDMDEPGYSTVDELLAAFFHLRTAESLSSPFLYGLPTGSCTLATAPIPEGATQSPLWFLLGKPGEGIDAGPAIFVNNPRFQRRVPTVPGTPGLYRSTLSGSVTPRISNRPVPLLLDPGPIQVRGGGATVSEFTISLKAPSPIERNAENVIHSTRESLHLEWRTPESQRLVLVAASAISATSATAVCLCLEKASKGAFTIPKDLLAHLPLSRQTPGQPAGRITLISWPEKLEYPINAKGLTNGEAISVSAVQSAILFR
ncbi:MAG: hypothetical protein JST93_24495 [Acidobacteria bacterium]|nr:hypothetical protein [Acidobacteriota bacterium]